MSKLTSKLERDSHFFVANFLTFVTPQTLPPFGIPTEGLVGIGGNILFPVGFFCCGLFVFCLTELSFSWLPVQTGIFDIEPISLFGVEHRVEETLSASNARSPLQELPVCFYTPGLKVLYPGFNLLFCIIAHIRLEHVLTAQ